MPLVKRDKLAPSKRPYALNLETAIQDPLYGRWNVEAYWVGRKNGRTTITFGTLRLGPITHRMGDELTLERAVAEADMRYGGDWWYQWDGQVLLTNPAVVRPGPYEQLGVTERLDVLLNDLPNVPDDCDGWYYRVPRA